MMVERTEALQQMPEFWRTLFVQVPAFSEAVITARTHIEAAISQYITEKAIAVPDFSKISTVEQLYETGWRFHTTHWGILVPPDCPIKHDTVAIYCQVCGGSSVGWQNRLEVATNPTAHSDRCTGKLVREALVVCSTHSSWLLDRWKKGHEASKHTAPATQRSAITTVS